MSETKKMKLNKNNYVPIGMIFQLVELNKTYNLDIYEK